MGGQQSLQPFGVHGCQRGGYLRRPVDDRRLVAFGDHHQCGSDDAKAPLLALINKFSPVGWRQVHLNTFRGGGGGQVIDLDAVVAGLDLTWRNFLGLGITTAGGVDPGCPSRALPLVFGRR